MRAFLKGEPEWRGWQIRCIQHSDDNGFNIKDRYSSICQSLGPVLVIRPVQKTTFIKLRNCLQPRVVVLDAAITCCEDIWSTLTDLKEKHDAGAPLLPIKYVAAMHILWKLNRERRWGGNAKSYMWSTDVPKGRGMPDEVSDVVLEVASDLQLNKILGFKRSKTGIKYCLNSECRALIYEIIDHPRYPDDRLPKSLSKSREQVSARLLDDGIRLRNADRAAHPSV